MWMHSGDWTSGPVSWVWYVAGHTLWWSLMIVGAIALVFWSRRLACRDDQGEQSGRAIEILAERYARGEITQEEFELRRRVLRN